MLSKNELNRAIEIAKKYKIGKLYIVGSALHGDPKKANDYGFAIDDYRPDFFSISTERCLEQCPKTLT